MARTVPVHTGYTILNGIATGSNGGRIDVWVEYTTGETDILKNQTPVIAYFYAALNSDYTATAMGDAGLNSSFAVNGEPLQGQEDGAYDFTSPDKLNLLGIYRGGITHEPDGTAQVTFAGAFTTLSTSVSGGSISATVSLPPIPKTVAVSASDRTLGERCYVQWTPELLDDSFVLMFSTENWSRSTARIYPNTTGRFTYTGTVLDMALAAYFKTCTTPITVTLLAYRDDVFFGSSQTEMIATVPENAQTRPTVEVQLYPLCTQFPKLYVQRLGRVRAVGSATDPYGADITGWQISVGGVTTLGHISGYLEKSGTVPVRVEVTNSRGFVGAWEGEISVYAYDRPRLEGTAYRCLADGTADSGGTCLYIGGAYRLDSLGGQNTGLFQWRLKPEGGSYGPWQDFSDRTYGETVAEGLNPEKAYQVQLRVTDTAGSVAELTFAIPQAKIYMHKTANALGMGGYVEQPDTLSVHWDILAHKAINGAYIRTVTVTGNAVTLPFTGTFLVLGGGVLGVLTVTAEGVTWSGTEGVTAAAAQNGATLTLPRAGSKLLLLSPEIMEI